MLSRTHGQPATPTLLGKEILVYCERLNNEIELLNKIEYSTKFGGAVGTKDFTAGQLKDIEKGAKSGAQRVKRETAQKQTSRKRLTRGTGGLAAKARPVGAESTTGLPDLGTGGLQLGTTSLGKGLLV